MERNLMIMNGEFGRVRTMIIENEDVWFVGKDVAECLGYKDTSDALKKHIDEDDKMGGQNTDPYVIDNLGRKQYPIFINESGLYSLVLSSKLDNAKKFKKWVTSEVLPSIRKNGMYATEITLEKMISDPSFAIQLLTKLKEEQDKRKELEQKVEQDKPKVEYHDNVLNTDTCYTTTQIAKELEMSARQLNILLHHMGVQFKQSGQWLLTSKYQDKGYVRTRTHLFTDSKGESKTRHSTVWTEKGREFLIDLSEDF